MKLEAEDPLLKGISQTCNQGIRGAFESLPPFEREVRPTASGLGVPPGLGGRELVKPSPKGCGGAAAIGPSASDA